MRGPMAYLHLAAGLAGEQAVAVFLQRTIQAPPADPSYGAKKTIN
jgi:hypothetical protein